MTRKRIYPTLSAWRDGQRLNQSAAATRLGVSQAYYSRLERCVQCPRAPLAKAISQRTGVPLEIVLGVA